MKKLPTDLEILNLIYEQYYETFSQYDEKENKTRSTKNRVPINIDEIANKLKVDPDIIFGRLYYHLNKKYGYRNEDGTRVSFFTLKVGKDSKCINFPLASSVLADLRNNKRRYNIATWIAVISVGISVISIIIQYS
jgi:hypothetical protein